MEVLAELGPGLGRPFVDTLKGSRHSTTLEEYVAALGGRLELHAVFPDEVIALEVRPRRRARDAAGSGPISGPSQD